MLKIMAFIYNNLPELLTVISIVVALIIAMIEWKRMRKKVMAGFLALAAICASLIAIKNVYSEEYSQVPNAVGLTYSEALQVFNEIGVDPLFVLTSTNELSSETCRVCWQSLKQGDIVEKYELCILLMSDDYRNK